jgi:transcriptional regulator with XRE-family HTH domain
MMLRYAVINYVLSGRWVLLALASIPLPGLLWSGMSEQPMHNAPFQTLGKHLRYLREQSKESVAEVSGAVEIDEPALARIEAGFERPAEDILLLLINHFGMPNQEAIQLWELAGYDGDMPDQFHPTEEAQTAGKSIVMLLALDMRTAYTDGVDIQTSQSGLTMNFSQSSGQDRPMPVARLGMSYEQAEQVLQQLQQTLLKAKYLRGPKVLPPRAQPPHSDEDEQ